MLKNDIKFLGTSGSKQEDNCSSCLQITDTIIIDAGNVIDALGDEAQYIEHIFLTHSHLDHISDIAFLIETYFADRSSSLKIYALKETIKALNDHIFNWSIWPGFQEISLINSKQKSIEFIELEIGKEYKIDEVVLKPIELNHTVATCGYVITKENICVLYATDTYKCNNIWHELNYNKNIDSLIIDVSFPSEMAKLAKDSKHLTPMLLKEELTKLKRDDISIYVTHIKPNYQTLVEKELNILKLLKNNGRVLKDGDYLKSTKDKRDKNSRAIEISSALSKEKDLSKILGLILEETMECTNAEGGTIYLKEDNVISFKATKNTALNIFNIDCDYPKIDLYKDGKENSENISAVSALRKKIINIPNIYMYHMDDFNFEGTKKFDKANNYQSKSMLVVPMINHDDEVVGVIQLINKKSLNNKGFTQKDVELTSNYANLSATAIAKNRLIDDLEKLIISFLESISYALNVKSPYGYSHLSRVKEITGHVAREIHNDNTIYKDIRYTKEQFQEIELAAWMHDIGKISTPEHILDKATRLEVISDKINLIETRFALIKESLKSSMLEQKFKYLQTKEDINSELINNYNHTIAKLDEYLSFIKYANKPSTIMSKEDILKIEDIAKKEYKVDNKIINLLQDDEVEYLCIQRGTLSAKERQKINQHAQITYDMLKMIVFPKKYSNVTKIASGHHEKLNGKGYPLGLKADEISFETRILAIVDILEALTSKDRPYKRAKTYKETFEILEEMARKNEIDADIVAFIKKAGIFEKYIEKKELEKIET